MRSWEGEKGTWKQERGVGALASCTNLQGVNFPELRAGGPRQDSGGGGGEADGSLTCLFILGHLGCHPTPARSSKVVPNPTP